MRFHQLTIPLGIVALTGCSVVGVRTVDQPPYQVLNKDGDVEIRQYQPSIVAQTVVEADYRRSGDLAFNRLGGYIFGKNRQKTKVAMTAPVLQQPAGDKWTMTFIMPREHTMQTLPTPNDANVQLRKEPARKVATLRYSGALTEASFHQHAGKLKSWLEENHHTMLSAPRLAAYDPPWTVAMMRRNEVHIDVE